MVLVDGENFPAKHAANLIEQAGQIGSIVEVRVYGHYAEKAMSGWREACREFGMTSVDVAVAGANSADFSLTIEAVDMLHTRELDAFCIVSSDTGFSAVARRIRASAVRAYGIGEKKAKQDYRNQFDDFIEMSASRKAAVPALRAAAPSPKASATTAKVLAPASKIVPVTPKQRAASPSRAPRAAPAPIAKSPARPAPARKGAAAKATPSREAFLSAVDAAKKDDAGWSNTRDVGHVLKGGYRVKDAIREYGDAVDVEKRGNMTFVRRKQA
jgi:hypothetical protein